jgi:hypothetical protein
MSNTVRVSDNHLQYDGRFVDTLINNSVYVCWLGDEHTHESPESKHIIATFAGSDRHLNRVQHAAYSRVAVCDRFVLNRAGTRDIYVGVVEGPAVETVVAEVAIGTDVAWRGRVSSYCTRTHERHIASRLGADMFVAEAVFPVSWTRIPAATDEQIAWCNSVRGTFVHRTVPFPA